jgi:hypothetical protein
MMTDSVNFPAHYQSANGVECIEAINQLYPLSIKSNS